VRAAQKPVVGRDRVAKFISAVASHFWGGMDVAFVEANGQSCMIMSRDGAIVALASIDASEQGIDQIMWFMRPSKLVGISLRPHRAGPRATANPGAD